MIGYSKGCSKMTYEKIITNKTLIIKLTRIIKPTHLIQKEANDERKWNKRQRGQDENQDGRFNPTI